MWKKEFIMLTLPAKQSYTCLLSFGYCRAMNTSSVPAICFWLPIAFTNISGIKQCSNLQGLCQDIMYKQYHNITTIFILGMYSLSCLSASSILSFLSSSVRGGSVSKNRTSANRRHTNIMYSWSHSQHPD